MNVTYACPRCQQTVRVEYSPGQAELLCPACHVGVRIPDDAVVGNEVARCLVCPSHDLFLRKDFPQRLGVAIVVLGFVGSSIAWYYYLTMWTFAILFATALIDVVLYLVVGNSLMCYRCHAEYRGFSGSDKHGYFELETHERYRQEAARLAEHRTRREPSSTGG
jgi:hypothetical protein